MHRLEGKLMEAGVNPADIEKATQPRAVVKDQKPVNPAAAAMMQVPRLIER